MRQSAAHSRHWLLTASGARGVRDWCLASGRWRSGRRQTDPASGPRPPTQMRPFSLCYRCLQRRQSGVQLVQPQLESALVIAEWPASRPEPHAIRLAAGSAIGPVAAARALHGRHSAGLDCHGRLACAEAMRTAIMGSPFAPLTPHFIWHISRQLAGAPDVALSSPASASPSIEPLLRSSVSVYMSTK